MMPDEKEWVSVKVFCRENTAQVNLITAISRRYYAVGTMACARLRYALPRRSAAGDGAEYVNGSRAVTMASGSGVSTA